MLSFPLVWTQIPLLDEEPSEAEKSSRNVDVAVAVLETDTANPESLFV